MVRSTLLRASPDDAAHRRENHEALVSFLGPSFETPRGGGPPQDEVVPIRPVAVNTHRQSSPSPRRRGEAKKELKRPAAIDDMGDTGGERAFVAGEIERGQGD